MISVKHRFHGRGSLKYVHRQGSTVRGPLLSIKSVANPQRQSWRLAVIISRKINKSAVARNRMRRRIYEAVRSLEPDIAGPHDIVITVFNNNVLEVEFEILARQIKKQLKDAGVVVRKVR